MISSIKVLVALLVASCAGVAHAGDPEIFHDPTAGFQVTKPPEWHYVTAAQNMENIKGLKLNDEEFRAAMEKYATAPLVAMAKFREPYDDLNPSFKVNLKPYGELKGMKPTEILDLFLSQFETVFEDFELVQEPTGVEVSGIESAYAKMNYTLEGPDDIVFPTTSELWIVPHGDYFFVIGAGTRQDEETGSRKEIATILETVKIEQ